MTIARVFADKIFIATKQASTGNKNSNTQAAQATAQKRVRLARGAPFLSGKARTGCKNPEPASGYDGAVATSKSKAPPFLPAYAAKPVLHRSSKLYLSRRVLAGTKVISYKGLQGLYGAMNAGVPYVYGVVWVATYVAASATGAIFGAFKAAGIRKTTAEHLAFAQKLTRQVASALACLLVATYLAVAALLLVSVWLLSMPFSVAAMPIIKIYDHFCHQTVPEAT